MTDEPTAPTPEQKPPAEEATPTIQFDDFTKLDLRIGKVIEVAEHPNADKLLVLKVDLGSEQRTICAGMKAYYSPEALLGQTIVMVANLAPRKMRGIESQGMMLAASTPDRSDVVILTTERDVPPGSSVS